MVMWVALLRAWSSDFVVLKEKAISRPLDKEEVEHIV